MGKKRYSPNDQRANCMNPNNSTYWASVDNRANQLNPNNKEFKDDSEKDE